MGLAVKYGMSSPELCSLNKISCRTLFPGQRIFVRHPDDDSAYRGPTPITPVRSPNSTGGGGGGGVSGGGGGGGGGGSGGGVGSSGSGTKPARNESAGFFAEHDLVNVAPLSSDLVENFVNSTMAMVKVMHVT
jgi:LysM repeat protein